jgi:two-component system phosphate regulon sensor histidine kinase PhoR
VRARIFWKIGLTYLALLVGVLLAVDFYSAEVLRREYIRKTNEELTSLLNLGRTRPPAIDDPSQLRSWVEWMSQSGARVTAIDSGGKVLADSAQDPETMEDHSDRPEVQQAFANGQGQSLRFSTTSGRQMVYQAVRYQQPSGLPVVIRAAKPITSLDVALSELRRRLLFASLVIFLIGLIASLMISRMFSARVERLTEFSKRVAEGDFRPLSGDNSSDELAELGASLNETARRLESEIRT